MIILETIKNSGFFKCSNNKNDKKNIQNKFKMIWDKVELFFF